MGLSKPSKLSPEDDITQFSSGAPAVDEWLRNRAVSSLARGSAAVYVVKDETRVVGFYTLSASAVDRRRVETGKFKRNSPDPIPVLLLGQLGVDRVYQSRGLATGLLRDALIRALAISHQVGFQALLVEALNRDIAPWYHRYGFEAISEREPTMLMLRMRDIRATLLSLDP